MEESEGSYDGCVGLYNRGKNMKSFNELVKEKVKDLKFNTIVVDNLHAYGIMVDSLYQFLDLSRKDEPNNEEILETLVYLSAITKITSESLGLTREDINDDEIYGEDDKSTLLAIDVVNTIKSRMKLTNSIQKGVNRFHFEFDEEEIKNWDEKLENLF
jgi:hypothetical protein